MAKYGQDFLVTELYNNLLQLQDDFEKIEDDLIGKMYDFHIKVLKQHNGSGSSFIHHLLPLEANLLNI